MRLHVENKSPNGTTPVCFVAYTCIEHIRHNFLNAVIFTIFTNTAYLLFNFKYEQ